MKRYIVFAYDRYYPAGGLNDVKGTFDTYAEAAQFVDGLDYDYIEVVDMDAWFKDAQNVSRK